MFFNALGTVDCSRSVRVLDSRQTSVLYLYTYLNEQKKRQMISKYLRNKKFVQKQNKILFGRIIQPLEFIQILKFINFGQSLHTFDIYIQSYFLSNFVHFLQLQTSFNARLDSALDDFKCKVSFRFTCGCGTMLLLFYIRLWP